jgi:hypothetical protein
VTGQPPAPLATCLAELRRRRLLPDSCVAAFAAGSHVLGWENASSDFDLYIISTERWRSDSATAATVALQPNTVLSEMTFVDRRRWDIEYWLDSQVDQLMRTVSWREYDTRAATADLMTWHELSFLERLAYGAAVTGEEWLAPRRRAVEESALRSVVVNRSLRLLDSALEDAIGQLASGDVDSAVLSARQAFGQAIDALLASEDLGSLRGKWRARQFRRSSQRVLSFEEYWAVETMRTFDPADPAGWVTEVVLLCQRISRETGA